ncbi:MAG: NPCBM/NEW2 domain-containing protein [Planctomycetes bacterium]|nr:NPCBM/NEW2 domain-containing protein [Planctomycetota bacterium]
MIRSARLQRLLLLMCLAVWNDMPRGQRADASVVVLSNRTEQPVVFSLRRTEGEPTKHVLSPGKLTIVRPADDVQIELDGRRRYLLSPDTLGYFTKGPEGPVFQQVSFLPGDSPAAVPGDTLPAAPVVVRVVVAVDDEQPAAQQAWQQRLTRQVASASAVIARYCPVRFEVVATRQWNSDNGLKDYRQLATELRREVPPHPASLVIGFSSQLRIGPSSRLPHADSDPFFSHLLLPDIQKKFSSDDQLVFLVHSLGHYLGGVHGVSPWSVMRPKPIDGSPAAGEPALAFDPVNVLILNLVARQMQGRDVRRLSDLSRGTRLHLESIYARMAALIPDDPSIAHLVELAADPNTGQMRYTAELADGRLLTDDEVLYWHATLAQPRLAGVPLMDATTGVRWIRDNTLDQGTARAPYVEMVGGDRLPGRVTTHRSEHDGAPEHEGPRRGEPPHLVVTPTIEVNWPEGPQRATVRVRTRWIRRIVWKPEVGEYHPGRVFLRDGRELDFRVLRFEAETVRLLSRDGVHTVRFADMAELHLPQTDPWEAYFEQLAVLTPEGTDRLMRWSTVGGLEATCSAEQFQACHTGRAEKPDLWYHAAQPAWSLDPVWIAHRRIVLRRYFAPHEVPLSLMWPSEVSHRPFFGGGWTWQVDRNVLGQPLHCAGRSYASGLGVHGTTELQFSLPDCARTFRTQLGLDRAAGLGGYVRAEVLAGGDRLTSLYRSEPIAGSVDVLDTGPLPLGDARRRIVLRADAAVDDPPRGADPLDVRDLFDWLDPVVSLDPAALREEIVRRGPHAIAAWKTWEVATGGTPGAKLAVRWDTTDPQRPAYRSAIVVAGEPVTVSSRLHVGSDTDRLVIAIAQPDRRVAATLEVRIDGRSAARFEVPTVLTGQPPEPLKVALGSHAGKTVPVTMILSCPGAGSLVEWNDLRVER